MVAARSSNLSPLRDVHMPAVFIEGEVRWKMAAGPETIEARVSATALHLLHSAPLPSYLDVFEENRAMLNRVARWKFLETGGDLHNPITLGRRDLAPFVGMNTFG
jgi:hypothetical protein